MGERRGHEPDLASVRLVVYAMLLTLALVLVSAWPLWKAYQAWRPEMPPPTFAPRQVPPDQVRLQENPRADMRTYRAQVEQRLHSAGWVNRQAGVVHIPIEQAMTLLLERGLARPAEGEQEPAPEPPRQPQKGAGKTPAADNSGGAGTP